MNATKTYTTQGRSPATGVDIEACKRAAALEVCAGLRNIIHGSRPRVGTIRIRIAAIRLSIALGNQSIAESCLDKQSYNPAQWGRPAELEGAEADAQVLDAAVAREDAHPGLVEVLADLHAQLTEARERRVDEELNRDRTPDLFNDGTIPETTAGTTP